MLTLKEGTLWEVQDQVQRLGLRRLGWLMDYLRLLQNDHRVRLEERMEDGVLVQPETVLIPPKHTNLWLSPDPERADSLSILGFGRRVHKSLELSERVRFEALPPGPDLHPDVCYVDLRNPWVLRYFLRWLESRRDLPLRATRAPLGLAYELTD